MALQDSDNFIVGRDNESYKITYQDLKDDLNYVPPPTGTIDKPQVLSPEDGAGSGDLIPLNSDTITDVEGGGTNVYSTDTIANVDDTLVTTYNAATYNQKPSNTLTNAKALNSINWDTDADVQAYSNLDIGNATYSPVSLYAVFERISFSTPQQIEWGLKNSASELAVSYFYSDNPNGPWTFDKSYVTNSDPVATSSRASKYWVVCNGSVQLYNDANVVPTTNQLAHNTGSWELKSIAPLTTLTFPTANNFDRFEVGDVAQQVNDVNAEWLGKPATYGDRPLSNGFDDNPATSFLTPDNCNSFTVNSKNPITSLTIDIAAAKQESHQVTNPDGTIDNHIAIYSSNKWATYSWSGAAGYSFTITGPESSPGFSEIKINGTLVTDFGDDEVSITAIDADAVPPTITVDGGSWAGADGTGDAGDGRYMPSQEWSSSWVSGDFLNNRGPEVLFNGNQSNWTACYSSTAVWQHVGIPFSSIEFEITGNETGSQLQVNNTFIPANKVYSNTEIAALGITSPLTQFQITSNTSSGPSVLPTTGRGLKWIKLDGKLLVDSSIPGGQGATDISKSVAYDTKLTVASTQDLDKMSGSVFMTGGQTNPDGTFKPASYTPQTSTIASVGIAPTWNQSETWSNGWESPVPSEALGAFNGIIGKGSNSSGNTNNPVKWRSPVALNGDISVYTVSNTSLNSTIVVTLQGPGGAVLDSRTLKNISNDENQITKVDFTGITDCYVVEVEMTASPGTPASVNCGIEVNGKLLVDTGISGDPGTGDTLLTFNTPNPDLKYFQPGDQLGGGGFAPVLYTGNGGTQEITGVGFSPDLVWMKARNNGFWHTLYDTVRGPTKELTSNVTEGESVRSNGLTAFTNDGFTLNGYTDTNHDATNFVAWCWKSGDTTVTNNDGTIESQVRSNGNFSVVKCTYSGLDQTVGHGLSQAPSMVIVKPTSISGPWIVAHSGLTDMSDYYLSLNDTASEESGRWGTSPTSTVFGMTPSLFGQGEFIAYCWAETPGVSSFGEYSGSNETTTLNFGFRPAFVLIKCTSGTGGDWVMKTDETGDNQYLLANLSNAESTGYNCVFTDNGIELGGNYAFMNKGGFNYIYAAFAGSNPIEVVDVDVANNQMTVNNSGLQVGDVIDGSTESAEGTFLEADGTEVSLTDPTGRWIADNKAGTAFSIAGPSVMDNPLLTADITLVSSQFATTPVGQDNLKSAKWTITKQGGATEVLDANTNTSYDPPLGTFDANSTYTVSVEYEGYTLGKSAQSTSVTFTTGATRTMYDRVRLLQTRIDALEANEVSDDAVASSLVTLLGSINARVEALEADHMTLMNNNNNNSGY